MRRAGRALAHFTTVPRCTPETQQVALPPRQAAIACARPRQQRDAGTRGRTWTSTDEEAASHRPACRGRARLRRLHRLDHPGGRPAGPRAAADRRGRPRRRARPGTNPNDIQLPGPIVEPTTPAPELPPPPETTPKPKAGAGARARDDARARSPRSPTPARAPAAARRRSARTRACACVAMRVRRASASSRRVKSQPKDEPSKDRSGGGRAPLRNDDGTPSRSNPGFVDALPGPSTDDGCAELHHSQVPGAAVPAADLPGGRDRVRHPLGGPGGDQRDRDRLRPQPERVVAPGRSAGCSSCRRPGRPTAIDANKDGRKDPYNPVDAIFAAARYLKAANYENDVRAAIWAYNHADWYVDSVLLRARLIAGVPADLIGSLTGLTEGRFPVYARATYADDLAEKELLKRVQRGENAANVIESSEDRRSIDIFAKEGAPVVAVNDGVVKAVGRSKKLGRYVVLQDVYGNRYTYAHLGEVSKYYPVPKSDADGGLARTAKASQGQRRGRRRPAAAPTRLRRPPVRRLRQGTRARPRRRQSSRTTRRRPRRRSSSACSPTPTSRARARPAASSSSWRHWRARAASSRPTRTSSRGRSASTRARFACAPSRRARA